MKPYKEWLDIEQNEPEWEELRRGRVGASEIKHIMANYGKAFGEPAKRLAIHIANFELTGKWNAPKLEREDFDNGHEQEPIIREMYEEATFSEVTNGGYYIVSDREGVSPDGHVCDGLIEIKARQSLPVFYASKKRNNVAPTDMWQVVAQLKNTGRPWIDYVEGCLAFPEGKRLLIVRKTPDDYKKEFKQMDERMSQFFGLIEESKKVIMR